MITTTFADIVTNDRGIGAKYRKNKIHISSNEFIVIYFYFFVYANYFKKMCDKRFSTATGHIKNAKS